MKTLGDFTKSQLDVFLRAQETRKKTTVPRMLRARVGPRNLLLQSRLLPLPIGLSSSVTLDFSSPIGALSRGQLQSLPSVPSGSAALHLVSRWRQKELVGNTEAQSAKAKTPRGCSSL